MLLRTEDQTGGSTERSSNLGPRDLELLLVAMAKPLPQAWPTQLQRALAAWEAGPPYKQVCVSVARRACLPAGESWAAR